MEKLKRAKNFISIHTIVVEIKKRDDKLKVSSVKILQIINTPEFWNEFVNLVSSFVKK